MTWKHPRRRRSWPERARRTLRGILIRIVRLDDTPRSIALGTAVGVLIAVTPTYGVQVILVLLANTLLRVNRLAGVVAVHLTNPITAIPFYWLDYKIGVHVLGQESITQETFRAKMEWVSAAPFLEALSRILNLGGTILAPMAVGSLVFGSLLGAASYLVCLVLVKSYKEKRALRRARRKLRRRERRLAAEEAPAPRPGGEPRLLLDREGTVPGDSPDNGSGRKPKSNGVWDVEPERRSDG